MQDITLPEVGENIESGTVVGIAVKVGDNVQKDQDLLELETDKASLPVPSPVSGVVKEILIQEGQDVKIGSVIMRVEASEGSGQPAATQETPKAEPKETAPTKPAPEAPQPASAQPVAASSSSPIQTIRSAISSFMKPAPGTSIPAAPSVRRLAREIGVDITQVRGSGPGGRISENDVKAFAKAILQGGVLPAAAPASKPLPDFGKFGQIRREKMNNIRKKTAEHMSHCWTTIPHVTQFGKADITDLEQFRREQSTDERKLTVTPFLLKIMAAAMKEFPQFNASIDMDNKEIVYKDYINIGVAVDTDRGLLVPVLKDVDKKNIVDLTDELNEMAERARNKKTSLDELQGGSMTLTNLGGIFGTSFTPIVNWPEVAILGVSRGAIEQVYDKSKKDFVPRFMLPLSLSYDHRLIDGADGARYLKWICTALTDSSFRTLK